MEKKILIILTLTLLYGKSSISEILSGQNAIIIYTMYIICPFSSWFVTDYLSSSGTIELFVNKEC